jgi:molybdate transport system substrate-binding protein
VDLPTTIRILSSMATRRLLADLTTQFESTSPWRLSVESVGGVDAAKRVRAGEPFDIIVLANNVIDALIAEGHIVGGSRVDIVASPVAVAVRAGTSHPDISSAEAVKSAILAAASVGYSTGPSGTYLATLFDRWGIADAVKDRIRVAPPVFRSAAWWRRANWNWDFSSYPSSSISLASRWSVCFRPRFR